MNGQECVFYKIFLRWTIDLISDQSPLLSKEGFPSHHGLKNNSPLSLVLADWEAGCFLEPLLPHQIMPLLCGPLFPQGSVPY